MTNPTTTYLAIGVNLARMDEMGRLKGWEAFGQFDFHIRGVALSTDYHAELDTNQPAGPGTRRLVFKVTSTPSRPKETRMTDMTALENGTGPDTMWSLNGTADRVAAKVADENQTAARFDGHTRLGVLIAAVAELAAESDPAAVAARLDRVDEVTSAWRAVLGADADR